MKRGSQFPFNKRLAAGAVLALQAARDVLDDEDRRCRGVWARDEHGQQVPHTSPKSARFSLVGAIKAACLDLKLSWNVHQVAMLTMVLCLPEGQEYLDGLNDDPNVSHAEVLAVLDKDIALGVQTASDLGVPMWTIEQAARVWRFAASHGQAGQDMTELAKLIEGWAGAEIRSRPKP